MASPVAADKSYKQKQNLLLYGFPKNTEVTEKKVDVHAALQRARRPLASVSMTLEVFGAYAMPEKWKEKIVSYTILNLLIDVFIVRMILRSSSTSTR